MSLSLFVIVVFPDALFKTVFNTHGCAFAFLGHMRTQICIMTWVLQGEGDLWGHYPHVPIFQKAYKCTKFQTCVCVYVCVTHHLGNLGGTAAGLCRCGRGYSVCPAGVSSVQSLVWASSESRISPPCRHRSLCSWRLQRRPSSGWRQCSSLPDWGWNTWAEGGWHHQVDPRWENNH